VTPFGPTIRFGKALLPVALTASAATGLAPPAAAFPPAGQPAHCRAEDGYAAAFGGRRTFALKPDQLLAIKASRDPAVLAARAELIRRADAALVHHPVSVMDKRSIPPSGDQHDYISIAPYWWPNPANPSGPYVRRDGEVNPERDGPKYDRTAIGRMSADVEALTLAYFYTEDRRYAAKAAAMIRTWFLDPATAMNPNANQAQAVRGREEGRAEGVLDTNAFMPVVEGVGLIAPSHALSSAEQSALETWFSRYADWMLSSKNGRAEQAAKNNHGIWFDAQLTRYSLFARRPDLARKVVANFAERRIATQMTPDGRLPAELARTRSLHYTLYALEPAFDVADMALCVGVDLWHAQDKDGRSLRRATEVVAPYRGQIEKWPYKEIDPAPRELDALLARAATVWVDLPAPVPSGYPDALVFAPVRR
jgi:hypothetical protein